MINPQKEGEVVQVRPAYDSLYCADYKDQIGTIKEFCGYRCCVKVELGSGEKWFRCGDVSVLDGAELHKAKIELAGNAV